MKTLEIDDSKEQVQCPACAHTWWTTKVLPVVAKAKTIHCPECRAPLHPPAIEFNAEGDNS